MKFKKTEGGQGGKKGHSNMAHWEYTEIIKAQCRKIRRAVGKRVIKESLRDC